MSPPQRSTGHKGFCNNANTVQGGKGWGERGERGKPNDFNTNNLQGAFCKQRGGHHARSTCLSALTLIVRGRRKNREKKKKERKNWIAHTMCACRERQPCSSSAFPNEGRKGGNMGTGQSSWVLEQRQPCKPNLSASALPSS